MTNEKTRDEQLARIAHRLQYLGSAYTRMLGPNGNGDRVADLVSSDAFALGKRLKIVLQGEDDPGDDRYACWQIRCGKFKDHWGDHDIADRGVDPHHNEPEGTGGR